MHKVVQAAFDEIVSENRFYKKKGGGNPRLLVMSGLPMSGKSFLTNMICEKLDDDICVVRTDSIRPVITSHMGRREPVYTKDEHAHVFELGHELVKRAMENGWNVIADATNLTDKFRQWAITAAKGQNDGVLVAFLEVSPSVAMDRNAAEQERSGSTATPAVYALLNYEKEPIEKCTSPYVVINSEIDVKPWAESLTKWFRHDLERVPGTVIPKVKEIPSSRLR